MQLEADKIYQGTSQINLGTGPGIGPGVDTPLSVLYPCRPALIISNR